MTPRQAAEWQWPASGAAQRTGGRSASVDRILEPNYPPGPGGRYETSRNLLANTVKYVHKNRLSGGSRHLDAARRALAVELGVDPHTEFAPLASKLNDVATASALGGLSIRAALAAIPGGTGMAVSSTSTVETIRGTLVEKTSAQIVEEVKATLARLRVPSSVASRFVENRYYTPADLLIMVHSLAALRAENTGLFIARAVNAETREEAVFQRHRAELLAGHAKNYGIGAFIDVGGFPLNRLNDGRVIALFPFDEVSWTERVAGMFRYVAGAAPHEHGQPLLVTTGELTSMAKDEVGRLGWTVEHIR
jgi:hypothetical protein